MKDAEKHRETLSAQRRRTLDGLVAAALMTAAAAFGLHEARHAATPVPAARRQVLAALPAPPACPATPAG